MHRFDRLSFSDSSIVALVKEASPVHSNGSAAKNISNRVMALALMGFGALLSHWLTPEWPSGPSLPPHLIVEQFRALTSLLLQEPVPDHAGILLSAVQSGGRDRVPQRRAYSIPAVTRSRMTLRSSSAMAAITVNIALPVGDDVLSASWWDTKWIPRLRNSSRASTRVLTLWAKRSNRNATTKSKAARRASAMRWSRPRRFSLAPLARSE